MPTLDERIKTIDTTLCRYLDNIDDTSRGVISQDMLSQLKKLVEHIMLKFYTNGRDIDINETNINQAAEYAQSDGVLKILYRFREYLDIVTVHYTLDEESSERLMLKYYDYLLEIKNIMFYNFKIVILHNLDKFPLNLDTALQEYYTKIADKIKQYTAYAPTANDKYYIQKLKPFYVNGRKYYEVTFTPATDKVTKARRAIAFTSMPIIENYASKFSLVDSSIEILGRTMPVTIITGWEVAIRDCEFKNFCYLITGDKQKISYKEQREVCNYLTKNGFSLTDIMDFPDEAYHRVTSKWRSNLKSDSFIRILDHCRDIICSRQPGQNILRYLLFFMRNAIIKSQWNAASNIWVSNLYVSNGSRPFDRMPFVQSPVNHNPHLGDLFRAIKTKGREHELMARQLRNNTEISGRIFTPISELEHYGNVESLAETYFNKLWEGHRERSRIVLENGYAYINAYKKDTCTIISELKELSENCDPNYRENISFWLDVLYDVDCEEKKEILKSMFEYSKVAVIYGSAGVGKSTLVNHISNYYDGMEKLYLTQTHSATDNLKRRVKGDNEHCEFSTVAAFKKHGSETEYELLVLDECSTISNEDMVQVLRLAKFKHLLLVGDIYQISSIRFGNWFTAIRSFLPQTSVFELTKPYRAENQHLLDVWKKVRNMDYGVQEIIEQESCSLNVDESLFVTSDDDEAILCLNYDGLYGINNINRFLQEMNPNPAYHWDIQYYKVGDPVLFLENNRFYNVIYNNMRGRIIGIEVFDKNTANEHIQFDIELNAAIDSKNAWVYDIQYLGESKEGNSIVRFDVHKIKSTDEDDDGNTSRTLVPFQIAYALSIHKAQGLEYSSVKVVITDEVDELITHNIFYTAVTRAKKMLKIYWTPEVEKKVLEQMTPRSIADDIEILKHYVNPSADANHGTSPSAEKSSSAADFEFLF